MKVTGDRRNGPALVGRESQGDELDKDVPDSVSDGDVDEIRGEEDKAAFWGGN